MEQHVSDPKVQNEFSKDGINCVMRCKVEAFSSTRISHATAEPTPGPQTGTHDHHHTGKDATALSAATAQQTPAGRQAGVRWADETKQ